MGAEYRCFHKNEVINCLPFSGNTWKIFSTIIGTKPKERCEIQRHKESNKGNKPGEKKSGDNYGGENNTQKLLSLLWCSMLITPLEVENTAE